MSILTTKFWKMTNIQLQIAHEYWQSRVEDRPEITRGDWMCAVQYLASITEIGVRRGLKMKQTYHNFGLGCPASFDQIINCPNMPKFMKEKSS